jgi:hypothetical protein
MNSDSDKEKYSLFLNEIKVTKIFSEKITNIYLEELFNLSEEILYCSETEFLDKYLRRMKLVLEDMYSSKCFDNDNFANILLKIESKLYNTYYTPAMELVNLLKYDNDNIKQTDFTTYIKHCIYCEDIGYHNCKNKLTALFNKNGDLKIVICTQCKYMYFSQYVKMFCNYCRKTFRSSHFQNTDSSLQPATWNKYHCRLILNDQMRCVKCKGLFFFNIDTHILICQDCKFEIDPLKINWVCLQCKEEFKSGVKIYNPSEFKAIKVAIRDAIINIDIIKPSQVPCCDIDVSEFDFIHKKTCSGLLYSGVLNKKQLIVCSKCKSMTQSDLHVWNCPVCDNKFKETRTYNQLSYRNSGVNYSSSIYVNDEQYRSINVSERKSLESGKKDDNTRREELEVCPFEPEVKPIIRKSTSFSRNKTAVNFFPSKPSINNKEIKNVMTDDRQNILRTDEKAPNMIKRDYYSANKLINFSKVLQEKHMKDIRNSIEVNDFKDIRNSEGKRPASKEKYNIGEFNRKGSLNDLLNLKKSNNYFCEKEVKHVKEYNSSRVTANLNFYDFNCDDFNILAQIGEGTYGKIYLVEDSNKNRFSMKKIFANNEEEFESFIKEYELVKKSPHSNILKILGISKKRLDHTTYGLYILMELGITDWEKDIKQRKMINSYYSEKELIDVSKQLIDALYFLQTKDISHRDIKPQNIILFNNKLYKIADFGEAKQISMRENEKQILTMRGTELYMSPALFFGLKNNLCDIKHNTFKSDVFSLGYCLLYAATLEVKVLHDVRYIRDNRTLSLTIKKLLSKTFSLRFINLIIRMLDINESTRYDFVELKSVLNSL